MSVLIVMIGVLTVLAAAADRRVSGVGPWAAPLDLAVGLVFVAAAAVASGSDLERVSMALHPARLSFAGVLGDRPSVGSWQPGE